MTTRKKRKGFAPESLADDEIQSHDQRDMMDVSVFFLSNQTELFVDPFKSQMFENTSKLSCLSLEREQM